jgi:hypothetical protein
MAATILSIPPQRSQVSITKNALKSPPQLIETCRGVLVFGIHFVRCAMPRNNPFPQPTIRRKYALGAWRAQILGERFDDEAPWRADGPTLRPSCYPYLRALRNAAQKTIRCLWGSCGSRSHFVVLGRDKYNGWHAELTL